MNKLKIKDRYGVTPNDVLNNTKLTFKAKGLFGFIQSKPDGWDFSVERICLQTKDGRDSVIAGLKELEDAGYLKRTRYQDERGNWYCEYLLTEIPFTGFPEKENPHEENPPEENPEIYSNKDYSKKDISKKENSFESRFEREVLPLSGKTTLSRLRQFWTKVYTARYGVAPKVYLNGKDGGVLKYLSGQYNEWQVAALMVEHIESTDPGLEQAAHPLSWISNRVARYIADIQTELEWTDTLQIGKYVEEYFVNLPKPEMDGTL